MARKTKEQISYNMSRVRGENTALENMLRAELDRRGLITHKRKQ